MITLREAAQQALDAPGCERLKEWADIGPVQRAAVESFLQAALEQPEQATGKESLTVEQPGCPRCNHPLFVGTSCSACGRVMEQPEHEPVAWMHNMIEDNIITHRPADLDRHPERWKLLYETPSPCPTCEALARTVMMDQTGYDVKLRQNWVGLDLEEMDKIIDGNIKITDPRLRDGVYGVVLDTMTTLMERNGYDEADGTSNLHVEDV